MILFIFILHSKLVMIFFAVKPCYKKVVWGMENSFFIYDICSKSTGENGQVIMMGHAIFLCTKTNIACLEPACTKQSMPVFSWCFKKLTGRWQHKITTIQRSLYKTGLRYYLFEKSCDLRLAAFHSTARWCPTQCSLTKGHLWCLSFTKY